jgi:hypothetical protein
MSNLTQASSLSAGRPQTERWLVTNGDITVGPVHTELLLRGYMGGRIPEHCRVREMSWPAFRPLDGIREIGSLKRRLARDTERPLNLREALQRLPLTADSGELLTCTLLLAALALDANAGLVHRYRSPSRLPVASAAFGVMPERLGEVLPATDPAYQLALRGRHLCGNPRHGTAERLVAERLQHDAPLSSVVMTPVIASGRLLAMLELGRTEHPFRADDADDLAELAAQVALRLS